MNSSSKPILHISIYYRGSYKSKTELKKQLSSYTKRILSNPWEPSVDIRLDTFDEQEEKQFLQELTYDTVITYHTKQPLTTNQKLYTFVVLLISLTTCIPKAIITRWVVKFPGFHKAPFAV